MKKISDCVMEKIEKPREGKELQKEFHLTHWELQNIFTSKMALGENIRKIYFSTGEIYYQRKDMCKHLPQDKLKIIIPESENEVRLAVLSDTHFCHPTKSSLDYVKRIYDYCSCHKIPITIHTGDIVEGLNNARLVKEASIAEQFAKFLAYHPYDENIYNILLFGNHDLQDCEHKLFDPFSYLQNRRLDFIPVETNKGFVSFNQNKIELCHDKKVNYYGDNIIFKGHSHQYKVRQTSPTGYLIHVPSCSQLNPNDKKQDLIPSFLDVKFSLENGRFARMALKHVLLVPTPYVASESRFDLTEEPKKMIKKNYY